MYCLKLIKILNHALINIKANGQYEKIVDKWFKKQKLFWRKKIYPYLQFIITLFVMHIFVVKILDN